MNEMRNHIEPLPVDNFLARAMKVKLRQCIALAVHGQRTSGIIVHLDGVPVVHNAERHRTVMKL